MSTASFSFRSHPTSLVPVLPVDGPLDLAATLRGGQAFRWRTEGAVHEGAALGHRFTLEASAHALRWEAHPEAGAEEALRRYLRLDGEHAHALARLRGDPLLADAAARFPGLRLLRQDPWEATAAFVLSQNNNVRRLEGLLPRLAEAAGEAHHGPLGPWHAFPTPTAVMELGETGLRRLGCGYRAPYLTAVAGAVAEGGVDLTELAEEPLADAREALVGLKGVGRKVADCILLYALGRGEVFPVDRWMHRWLATHQPDLDGRDPEAVASFATKRWGRDAGLAQQLLFHATRLSGT